MGKLTAVPPVTSAEPSVQAFSEAVRYNLQVIAGQQQGVKPLQALPQTATLAEVIAALNQVIARLS